MTINRLSFIVACLLMQAVLLSPLHAAVFDQTHQLWQQSLSKYVKEAEFSSSVDYAAWKKQQQPLRDYLASISAVEESAFERWNRRQQLAFLINAYNAFTVQLILDNYPLDSIKDIGNFFRSAWKIEFFTLFGEERHLDYIEQDLIRGSDRYHEPRIHFALVCASIGCPKLQKEAFTEHNLNRLLQLGATTFLADRSRNRYVADEDALYLSPIFKWYGEDFEKKFGSVANYVLPIMTAGKVKPADQRVHFLDYDWRLNDIARH